MKYKGIFLSDLSRNQLWDEFVNSPYPKWSSVCLLKYLGFRVLDAAFVNPKATKLETCRIVDDFMKNIGVEKVLIRSDGGREIGAYPQGGNSIDSNHIWELVSMFQAANRAVILMQPTNRFTNKLVANLHLISSGSFQIDILGPGFDLGDLNRGLVNSEISIFVTNISWNSYDPPSWFFTSHTINMISNLRQLRLTRIGKELLPAIGINQIGSPDSFAESWLRLNSYIELLEDPRPTYSFRQISEMYENAFIVGVTYRQKVHWDNLVIGLSDLGDGADLIYWDIVNPKEKFVFK